MQIIAAEMSLHLVMGLTFASFSPNNSRLLRYQLHLHQQIPTELPTNLPFVITTSTWTLSLQKIEPHDVSPLSFLLLFCFPVKVPSSHGPVATFSRHVIDGFGLDEGGASLNGAEAHCPDARRRLRVLRSTPGLIDSARPATCLVHGPVLNTTTAVRPLERKRFLMRRRSTVRMEGVYAVWRIAMMPTDTGEAWSAGLLDRHR